MKTEDWLLLLTSDGTVAAVEGGAPGAWVRRRVDSCHGLPEAVLAASRRFLRELPQPATGAGVRRLCLPAEREGAPAFTLLAVDAIPLHVAEVDLAELVRRSLEPLRQQAETLRVTLRIEANGDLPATIAIDAEKIAWATTVLVGNALRHVRRGGDGVGGGRIVVRVGHSAAQHLVSLSVEDDGEGIDASVRPWLFQPNPATGQAAGVALRLVHDVVVAHGGGVVIRSSTTATPTEPRGTTVTLWLRTGR